MGNKWSKWKRIESSSNGRYDWRGSLTTRGDLQEQVRQFATKPPSICSFFAVRASFPDNLRSVEADLNWKGIFGGSKSPISLEAGNLGDYAWSEVCGFDPHPSEVTTFSKELFREHVASLHRIEDISTSEGLEKDISLGCLNTRNYSKTDYLDYQYTISGDWKSQDGDELGDINFRGYLSIEFAEKEYLLTGGMFPKEDISIGLWGEDIIAEEDQLASNVVQMMKATKLG
jgi:hypothetical protein